jgi:hypothetical protein
LCHQASRLVNEAEKFYFAKQRRPRLPDRYLIVNFPSQNLY